MATSPQPADPPLSLEPVVGWRAWRLRRVGGVLTLVSLTRDDRWAPNDAMEATCPRHRAPTQGCSCGLYAASSARNLAHSGVLGMDICVVGAIAMWGTVVEHARGARSQYAYPARLRLVCGRCLSAGAGAVDPRSVAESDGWLSAVCAKHRKGITSPSWPADQMQSELLSAYGVDLMPIERVALSLRTGPGPLRSNPPELLKVVALAIWSIVKFVLTGLFMLWAYSGLIIFALMLLVPAFNAVTHLLGIESADAATSSIAATSPSTQTYVVVPPKHHHPDRGTPRPYRRPPPAFAAVCGVGAGSHVEYVSCRDPRSDLFGFAERTEPKGPKTDCSFGDRDAYTRGPHYSICWSSFGLGAFVHPWANAPSPWSVPHQEGGALYEHR